MTDMGAEACSDRPRSKGDQIVDAVVSIESVVIHLTDLIDKIEGNDGNEKMPTVQPKNNLTLAEMLNRTPDKVHELEDEMHQLIERINSILF